MDHNDSAFMSYSFCLDCSTSLLTLGIISDLLIVFAYFSIPLAIFIFIRKIENTHFKWIYYAFMAFMFSGGTTHIFSIIALWKPLNVLEETFKVITAVISVLTTILLWYIVLKVLKIPSPSEFQEINIKLRKEVEKTVQAEHNLKVINLNLEKQIGVRTNEIMLANQKLKDEIERHKQTKQELQNSKEIVEKANKAKSEFVSKMSHELRTPLNVILGFTQLMLYDRANPLSGKNIKRAEEIFKSGKYLLNLINEILDLSRIDTGNLKISVDYICVQDEINESKKMVQQIADNKGVQIIDRSTTLSGRIICVDRVRFQQILLNLLTNSIKYTPKGGTVEIFCIDESHELKILIQDQGIGIPNNEIQHIFEPFYRCTNVSHELEGNGIGLSIVRQLVNIMGGKYGVESREGVGSSFWISFPIVDNFVNTEENSIEKNGIPKGSVDIIGGKYQVLYIEDNLMNLELVQEIFNQEKNIILFKAMSGKEGIEVLLKMQVDLILLDINLPDSHGFDLFKRIRNIHPNIAIIAISSNAEQKNINRALELGFDDYITKPIDIKYFLSVLYRYLNKDYTL